jgi:hypothetical protein
LSDQAHYQYIYSNPTKLYQTQSDEKLLALANKHPDLIIMDRKAYMCDKVRCFSMNDNLQKYYYGYGHHTLIGAQFFARIPDRIA